MPEHHLVVACPIAEAGRRSNSTREVTIAQRCADPARWTPVLHVEAAGEPPTGNVRWAAGEVLMPGKASISKEKQSAPDVRLFTCRHFRGVVPGAELPYAYDTQCLAAAPGFWVRLGAIAKREPSLLRMGPMHRLIARTLLFVLLSGVFSPFAAASTMSISHPHCNRKPVPAPASSQMPDCHHHTAATPETAPPASSDQVLGAKDCCQDHECCRSMARSQWAHSSLLSMHGELSRATHVSAVLDSQACSFEFPLDHPGRAPPVL